MSSSVKTWKGKELMLTLRGVAQAMPESQSGTDRETIPDIWHTTARKVLTSETAIPSCVEKDAKQMAID